MLGRSAYPAGPSSVIPASCFELVSSLLPSEDTDQDGRRCVGDVVLADDFGAQQMILLHLQTKIGWQALGVKEPIAVIEKTTTIGHKRIGPEQTK